MTAVVIITIESNKENKEDLRKFVEKHLNLESAARKENKQIQVHIESQEWNK